MQKREDNAVTMPPRSLLLKIYIGEGCSSKGVPVYEEVLWEAKQYGLSGATVIRGDMGLGHIGVLQDKKNPRNHDLPVLVEAIDSAEKIQSFIPIAAKLLGNHGIIATCEVTVVHQGKSPAAPKENDDPALKIKSYD